MVRFLSCFSLTSTCSSHLLHVINICSTMKILWNLWFWSVSTCNRKKNYIGRYVLCFLIHVQKYQICHQLFDPFVYLSKSDDVDSVRHKLLVDPLGVLTQELAVHGVALGLHVQRDRKHLSFDATHKVKVHFLVRVWHKVQLYRHSKNTNYIYDLSFFFKSSQVLQLDLRKMNNFIIQWSDKCKLRQMFMHESEDKSSD